MQYGIQWTLSKADTLGAKFSVRLREVSALERAEKFDAQTSKLKPEFYACAEYVG